jgi:hypothetical protein
MVLWFRMNIYLGYIPQKKVSRFPKSVTRVKNTKFFTFINNAEGFEIQWRYSVTDLDVACYNN